MILYLLNYKNYYNRFAKREALVSQYPDALEVFRGVNFNPNDEVQTEQILNYTGMTPDYLLVCADDNAPTIVSRWYVTEAVRLRNGQYKLSLLRDVVADWWDEIMEADTFVEKGYVDINDGAIFNDENVAVSQIKVSETLLQDKTKSGWIVGYYAAPGVEIDDEPTEEDTTTINYGSNALEADFSVTTIDSWPYIDRTRYIDGEPIDNTSYLKSSAYVNSSNLQFGFELAIPGTTHLIKNGSRCWCNANGTVSAKELQNVNIGVNHLSSGTYYQKWLINNAYKYIPDGLDDVIRKDYKIARSPSDQPPGHTENTDESFQQLIRMDGMILRVGVDETAKYYKIRTKKENISGTSETLFSSPVRLEFAKWLTALGEAYQEIHNTTTFPIEGDLKAATSYLIKYTGEKAWLELEEISPSTGLSFTISKSRRQLADAPWSMFCMPYGDQYVVDYNDQNVTKEMLTIKQNALQIASGFFTSAGKRVYDIQLLPYCPISKIRERGNVITLSDLGMIEHVDYELIPDSSQILFWASSSKGSFDIPFDSGLSTDPLQFKANMLTRFMRFVSPNANSIFEFNNEKNYGFGYINVDYEYKPYTPYIHLNPSFNGLYGQDYNDYRGLILGGDFSLTSTSNAWTEYQIANKNYQVMFDRQIEKMGVERKYQRGLEIANMIASAVGAGAQAGMAGATTGNPWGAAIGAGIGGGASLGAGIADVVISDKLYKVGLDYTKDMFGFQMENIKAVPNTITKISSINPNNKIFPYVERYECTEAEYNAVGAKLAYNGFTINRIGKLSEYINPTRETPQYIKGQIIRMETIMDDYHVAQAIASEINQGVYV